ncbi:DUF6378 domain-containing protein [bacterium]|nr:DUF6378 domain-containing protein [bacterium]
MSILQKALDLVNGQRKADYGSFSDNVERMQVMLNAMTGNVYTRHDIHAFFMALKLCRTDRTSWTDDTLTDLCGYAHLIQIDQGVKDE